VSETKVDVAGLRALLEKATPGEWVVTANGVYIDANTGMVAEMENCPEFRDNSAFIAAAHNAMPSLLAAAEERDRLREALEDLMEVQNGPPLLKYEAAWNAAMEKGYAALNGGTARA
jgi:hypothetical protein